MKGYSKLIKVISFVVIAFCYRKANILHRWSNILCIFYFLWEQRPVSQLQILLIQMKLLHAAFEQL